MNRGTLNFFSAVFGLAAVFVCAVVGGFIISIFGPNFYAKIGPIGADLRRA